MDAPAPCSPAEEAQLIERVLEELEGEGPRPSGDPLSQLRALLTVRPPGELSTQPALDSLLQLHLQRRGVVDASGLPALPQERIRFWKGDITRLRVDAIVNAANAELLGCFTPFHACIDNAIHWAAGPQLRADCARIREEQGTLEPTGTAKITRAYNLPSRFVVHTVGPIVRGSVSPEHDEALSSSYRACLEVAANAGARSIAFCSVSTGVFGFPKDRAATIALRTVNEWVEAHPSALGLIVFTLFSDVDVRAYGEALARYPRFPEERS